MRLENGGYFEEKSCLFDDRPLLIVKLLKELLPALNQ